MSDDKKFQKMMGQQVDREIQQKWRQQYDPKAYANFMKPALTCQVCGTSMEVNPQTGENKLMTEWERKWSVHRYCAEYVQNQLDRNTSGPQGPYRRP